MRSLMFLAPALLLAAAPPAAAGLSDLHNAIGLYTEVPSDLHEAGRLTMYEGDTGTFPVYVVLSNPYNENTGAGIAVVGGYEFRLDLPGNIFLLGAALPPSCLNFLDPPEFSVGASIPVSGDFAALATLTLGEFSGTGGPVHLAPLEGYPSLPGSLAVTDLEDEFSLSAAVPASGSFAAPVFCVFCAQNAETATWGGVKSLYH